MSLSTWWESSNSPDRRSPQYTIGTSAGLTAWTDRWGPRLLVTVVLVGLMMVGLFFRGLASDSLVIEHTHEVGNDGAMDALILAAAYLTITVTSLGLLARVTDRSRLEPPTSGRPPLGPRTLSAGNALVRPLMRLAT